jgi:hypothetical protein
VGGFLRQQAGDDQAPIRQIGIAKRLIVGEVRYHQQLDLPGAAANQIASHADRKEPVLFAMEDEDRDRAVPQ